MSVEYLLYEYLKDCPKLRKKVRLDPPKILIAGRWRAVRDWKLVTDGLKLWAGRGSLILRSPSIARDRRAAHRDFLLSEINSRFSPWRIQKLYAESDRRLLRTAQFLRVLLKRWNKYQPVVCVYPGESLCQMARLVTDVALWRAELRPKDFLPPAILVPLEWKSELLNFLAGLKLEVTVKSYSNLRSRLPDSALYSASLVHPYYGKPPEALLALQDEFRHLKLLYRGSRWELARFGLPVIWGGENRLKFNFFKPCLLRAKTEQRLHRHVRRVLHYRVFPSPDPTHLFFRFGAERWLQSLLIENIKVINPDLKLPVYCQVPTLQAGSRQVMDMILSTTGGALAVIELKAARDVSLLLQGFNYWTRVRHHLERDDFTRAGYFEDLNISAHPPFLYLVCPLFDFHRTLPLLCSILPTNLPLEMIGINADWRRGIRILLRRRIREWAGS